MSNDNNDIMKLSLTISKGKRNKRNIFIEELLKTFTDNQKIVLNVIDNEIKTRLTFYSSTGRSGEGLKHGFRPLSIYISIRNLATLLGIDKTNLLASQNQFHVLYKVEMREEDWYKKYYLGDFYFKYVGLIEHIRYISTLQNVKSKFILWYFEQYIPNYL